MSKTVGGITIIPGTSAAGTTNTTKGWFSSSPASTPDKKGAADDMDTGAELEMAFGGKVPEVLKGSKAERRY